MTRSHKVLGFLLVALLGIYGCTRTPPVSPGNVAALEAKVQRLEEDFRSAAAARDAFRQKLLASEEKYAAVQRHLEQALATATQDRQERDAARTEAKTRATERDNLQTQYDGFRKTIRELLGQADAAMTSPGSQNPTTTLATTPTSTPLPTIPSVPTTPTAPTSPSPENTLRN